VRFCFVSRFEAKITSHFASPANPATYTAAQTSYSFVPDQSRKNQENLMPDTLATRPDEGMKKGAVEDDAQRPAPGDNPTNSSMSGQLGHRDQDEMLKDADTDFPEPDAEAEHSGR
jgi:hypothetical protein